jgi:hypothetical protein
LTPTPLRPSGKVAIDRRIHEAVSETGFIDRGLVAEVTEVAASGWS